MSDRAKIITIYVVVGLLSVGVLATSLWIRADRKKTFDGEEFAAVGKTEVEDFGAIENDLELVNQDGETVRMSELKDKVWVATNFFASCPECLKTSSGDLQKLYAEFRDNPDFQIVSITVNPAQDQVEDLKHYAEAMNADTENWWFLRGDEKTVHDYVEKEMKFMRVARNDPESARLYSHDLGLQVYGRGWKRVKKRDLHWAQEQNDEVHQAYFEDLRATIARSLAEDGTPAGETGGKQ